MIGKCVFSVIYNYWEILSFLLIFNMMIQSEPPRPADLSQRGQGWCRMNFQGSLQRFWQGWGGLFVTDLNEEDFNLPGDHMTNLILASVIRDQIWKKFKLNVDDWSDDWLVHRLIQSYMRPGCVMLVLEEGKPGPRFKRRIHSGEEEDDDWESTKRFPETIVTLLGTKLHTCENFNMHDNCKFDL